MQRANCQPIDAAVCCRFIQVAGLTTIALAPISTSTVHRVAKRRRRMQCGWRRAVAEPMAEPANSAAVARSSQASGAEQPQMRHLRERWLATESEQESASRQGCGQRPDCPGRSSRPTQPATAERQGRPVLPPPATPGSLLSRRPLHGADLHEATSANGSHDSGRSACRAKRRQSNNGPGSVLRSGAMWE